MADADRDFITWLRERGMPAAPEVSVDVVYGGAFSVKDYYMESGNPRQMRGASQLLMEAAEAFAAYTYFACGAEVFLIAPQGAGADLARGLEEVFREKTITGQAAAVWREDIQVKDLLHAERFDALWRGLNDDFYARRMMIFPAVDKPQDNRRCPGCNFRDIHTNGLCVSCHKRQEKGRGARAGYRQECLDYGKDTLGIALSLDETYEKENSIELLADGSGDFALLYADVNNLGAAGKKLGGNVQRRRAFTRAVQATVKAALYTAALKAVRAGGKMAFEIIAAGGDDICALLPGDIALLAGTLLLEEFDRCWKGHANEYGMLTISAGIAVGQAKTPILYMRETAEQLLKIAKRKAWDRGCSCLDILSLNSDGQWATKIKDKLRADLRFIEENQIANCTMRPYTAGQARKALQWLNHDIAPSTLHSIAEVLLRCGIAEGNLWFRYLLSRQNDPALANMAKDIAPGCGMFYKGDGGELISPWLDLAQLRGQRGGDVC